MSMPQSCAFMHEYAPVHVLVLVARTQAITMNRLLVASLRSKRTKNQCSNGLNFILKVFRGKSPLYILYHHSSKCRYVGM